MCRQVHKRTRPAGSHAGARAEPSEAEAMQTILVVDDDVGVRDMICATLAARVCS